MQRLLSKFSWLFICFGLSQGMISNIYAASSPKVSFHETVPTSGYYQWGLEGLYAVGSSDGGSLQYASIDTITDNLFAVAMHAIHPAWQWGFRLDGGYYDTNGMDYSVEWTHVDQSRTNHLLNGITSDFAVGSILPNDLIDASARYHAEEINLMLGYTFNPENKFSLRLHGGLSYLALEQSLRIATNFLSVSIGRRSPLEPVNDLQSSKFGGLGLRTGADLQWHLTSAWSWFAKGAMALFWGDLQSSAAGSNSFIICSQGSQMTQVCRRSQNKRIPYSSWNAYTEKSSVIVPLFQGEVGLAWQHHNWILRGGWRENVMLHTIKYMRPYSHLGLVGETSNFAYTGVFIGVDWRSA